MVEKTVIQKWSTRLRNSERLIPADHLLLYDCLAEPDEDITLFTQSFILVGPEQNGNRAVLKQLNLSFSDFTYPDDSHIAVSVLNWLSGLSTQDDTLRDQFVTKRHNLWIPSWNTKNLYMPEGASYMPLLN